MLEPGGTTDSFEVADRGSYWEQRARRFGRRGKGLAATCSYGMPGFYNAAIDLCQRRALAPWLEVDSGTRVLDIGCGVGRWCLPMAARGADVMGVDISRTMISEASSRAARAGLSRRCRFAVQDVSHLEVGGEYDLILGVTVLQHILAPRDLQRAAERLSRHLSADGRLVLLEVATSRRVSRCDSAVFRARRLSDYVRLFDRLDLGLAAVGGVDPTPLKTLYLPWYGRLPRPLAVFGLGAVTAITVPLDLLLADRLTRASWHKVMVFERRKPRRSG